MPMAAPSLHPILQRCAQWLSHTCVVSRRSCFLQPVTKTEFGTIFGPAFMHAIGHIAANISFAAVAISLTHTVKTLEPAFNVVLSRSGHCVTGPLNYCCCAHR